MGQDETKFAPDAANVNHDGDRGRGQTRAQIPQDGPFRRKLPPAFCMDQSFFELGSIKCRRE